MFQRAQRIANNVLNQIFQSRVHHDWTSGAFSVTVHDDAVGCDGPVIWLKRQHCSGMSCQENDKKLSLSRLDANSINKVFWGFL